MAYTAADYLGDVSLAMRDAYTGDCVTHACRIAELLLSEGRPPWIGRVRDLTTDPYVFLGPLIPSRFAGRGAPVWNTHYVACSGGDVFDPLVGAPIGVERYTSAVFGKELDVTAHFDCATTEQLLMNGTLERYLISTSCDRREYSLQSR